MKIIRRRLECVLVLSLFLPVVFDAMFKNNVLSREDTILGWGLVVAFIILNFFMFELEPQKISNRIRKLIDIILLTNIFAFVPVLVIVAIYKGDGVVEFPVTLILYASQIAIMCLPFILFCLQIVLLGNYWSRVLEKFILKK